MASTTDATVSITEFLNTDKRVVYSVYHNVHELNVFVPMYALLCDLYSCVCLIY